VNETSDLEGAAGLFDEAADELELAAQHCRTAAGHFREQKVPRGAAHAWAAFGHVLNAQERLERQARIHAGRSNP
jgi:heme oxygenase